ncbi:hypothetical protein BSKO_11828 [Bryopsis sp. KO-2023]|nr:hypothetical protein BSKO_11828 [Bryopsis sp. KO-2023]
MAAEATVLSLTRDLLSCIAKGNYGRYQELCADDLTCFEPEAGGYLVEGLPFHKWYFDLNETKPSGAVAANQTISSPKVRMMGENAAVVVYIRLQQIVDENGRPKTVRSEETRVWQKIDGKWKNVHFHRSSPSS